MDYKALTEALTRAKEAATAAGANIVDGGTCNFDNPAKGMYFAVKNKVHSCKRARESGKCTEKSSKITQ